MRALGHTSLPLQDTARSAGLQPGLTAASAALARAWWRGLLPERRLQGPPTLPLVPEAAPLIWNGLYSPRFLKTTMPFCSRRPEWPPGLGVNVLLHGARMTMGCGMEMSFSVTVHP